jgi:hypothetical protein
MLETQFPRIPGDIGHAGTWDFPVHYRVVRGATPDNVVRGDAMARLEDFVAAGRDLIAMGCDGIATNCGFLSLMQTEMAAALSVPVATSALMQAPMIAATLPPDRHVSILTISKATLTRDHLDAAGVAADVPVVGTDGSSFTRDVLGDAYSIDFATCRDEMLEAAERLVTAHPQTGAILLECTNMVPYAADIRGLTGLPVYSIETLLTWFQAGLVPRRFPQDLDDWR